MRYSFNDFEFDSTSLVLKKSGELLSIRHNEAKLLKLLVEQADTVFSKEDILSHVWHDKVVSEQAVFQNISHLRGLFGNQAIKTFSKRGYQWQLKLDKTVLEANETANTISPINLSQQVSTSSNAKKNIHWLLIALTSLVLCIVVIINFSNSAAGEDKSEIINIAYVPITDQQAVKSFILKDNEHFNFTELSQFNTASFQASAELEYPLLADKHPLILSGSMRTYDNKTYLDFILKGRFASWQGQISDINQQTVFEQLQLHLRHPVIYSLLNKVQPPDLKQANLSIAHQQSPDDLIILVQLISSYIKLGELEKGMVMANKLENSATFDKKAEYIGKALLLQSEILTKKELYDLSADKLKAAIKQFVLVNDFKQQADAWFAQSWIAHNLENYHVIKTSLLKSAKLAADVKDKQRELSALTYLSVLAHKHYQEDDKYLYLRLAEQKMEVYQLPSYHFAIVPYHYAIFAKSKQDKEPHLKQVLELASLTPDFWAAQNSRKQLMQFYLSENRMSDAKALIVDLHTNNAQNSYLKTLLAQAQKNEVAFVSYAQTTFEQAELAGDSMLSLDMALLICSSKNSQINYGFYCQYINEKGTDYWRRNNKEKLLALKL